MAQIMEPKAGQSRFLCQSPPCRSPAFQMPIGIEFRDLVINNPINHPFPVELEFWNKGSKDVVRRLDFTESICSLS